MPINIPGIPIQPVPIGQVPGVVPQIPPHMDPSMIIMQAAQLRQQRDLAQQEMQQKSMESLTQAIQGAASLAEHKREAVANENMAQMMHDIAFEKLPLEKMLLGAHANMMQSIADMNASGMGDSVQAHLARVAQGLETPDQMAAFMSRFPQGAKLQAFRQIGKSNANLKTPEIQYKGQVAGATALGAQAPTVAKIDSMFTQINRFNTLAGMVPKTVMDSINKAGLNVAAANGPTDEIKIHAKNLLQQANILKDEASSTFGSQSDARVELGGAIFDPNPNAGSIMSQNQIAKYSLLSRRNRLDSKPDNYLPPSFDAMPPTQSLSGYLQQGKAQGWNQQTTMNIARMMAQSGLLQDDLSGR